MSNRKIFNVLISAVWILMIIKNFTNNSDHTVSEEDLLFSQKPLPQV